MKKQSIPTDYVTKQDLLELLEQLEERLENRLEKRLDAKMAIRFEDFEHRMDDKFRKYTNEILTHIDAWSKKFQDISVDQSIITGKIEKNKLVLKDHEKRITKLENKN